MKKLWWLLLLAGCVTSAPLMKGPVNPARERLDALPRCAPGAEVGVLTVRATTCTKMFCQDACCNHCSWEAWFEKSGGASAPVEAARVEALLGVTGSALDCEIAAWGEALSGLSVSLDPACVAR
ncbi:MAG: hypothetical protein Q8L48_03905 [Archangium sp.]|nr:hypothetical protein [Archangium sp.]